MKKTLQATAFIAFMALCWFSAVAFGADYFKGSPAALFKGSTVQTGVGGVTTLTISSNTNRVLASGNHTDRLPVATTIGAIGRHFDFANRGSGTYTIQYQDGTTLTTVLPGRQKRVALTDASTSNGVWDVGFGEALSKTGDTMTGPLGLDYSNVTPDRAAYVDGSRLLRTSTSVSSQELEYLDGVTANIQAQLNAVTASIGGGPFLPIAGGTLTGALTVLSGVTSTGVIKGSGVVTSADVQAGIASTSTGALTTCNSATSNCSTITRVSSGETRIVHNGSGSLTQYAAGDERTSTTSSAFTVTNVTTSSTSKDTGALIVANGGAGVEGNIYAGGIVSGTSFADNSRTVETPSGVTSYVIGATVSTFVLAPSTNISTATVSMPTGPLNNQMMRISCSGLNGITTLVHLPSGGQTLDNPLTSCTRGAGGEWIYSTGTGTWYNVIRSEPTVSELYLQGATTYGSTATKIRRYINLVRNTGNSWTLTQSATNGDFATLTKDGVYEMGICDNFSAAANAGVSINASSTTNGIQTLSNTELACGNVSGGVDIGTCCTRSMYLPSGTVIRPHTDGTANGSNLWMQSFTIRRISN